MPHGVDLLRCLERVRSAQNTEESTSCTLSIKIEPDSRGTRQGMTSFAPYLLQVAKMNQAPDGRLQSFEKNIAVSQLQFLNFQDLSFHGVRVSIRHCPHRSGGQ